MSGHEARVLVVAPTGRDADLICQLLREGGEQCQAFRDLPGALREAEAGVGAFLFADEALDEAGYLAIRGFREHQPPWSDPPMLILTRRGAAMDEALSPVLELGKVWLIERPVGRRPLLSAVQTALRARVRQYQVRTQMAELARIGEELRIANSRKDELLALVSHELRTPLTSILGGSDLLLRRGAQLDSADSQALVRDIHDHGKRLQRVIENMLVLSRAETALETNTEPLLLQRLIPPLIEDLTPLQGCRRLNLEMAPDLPPVLANAVFVELVVTNLIRNSEKYAFENTDVDVGVEQQSDTVAVTVTDRGRQFDEDQVQQMFEVFYRDPDHSLKITGLGLGLPVCKRLTEIQGGSINARPREGGGLEVTVSLPVVQE